VRIAVIGTPGAWSTERLADAVRRAGAEAAVVDLDACSVRPPDPRVFHRGEPLAGLDGAVVKKIGDTAGGWAVQERLHLLHQLEASGVPVVSRPGAVGRAMNRFAMTLELARAGLPVPETVVTEDAGEVGQAVERFGIAVAKPLFTSKGRGMALLRAGDDVAGFVEGWRGQGLGPVYLQRFVKHPGRDLGVAVLDGRYLGAYWRVAGPDAWMTTILAGGRYERADPAPGVIALAERAARHFGLLFTGVDLIETPEGDMKVLEVSAFGGFRGLLSACDIDAAPLLAAAALRHLGAATGRDLGAADSGRHAGPTGPARSAHGAGTPG
jgi:ribosomal protein S6--L-glutamate ligase